MNIIIMYPSHEMTPMSMESAMSETNATKYQCTLRDAKNKESVSDSIKGGFIMRDAKMK